MLTLFRATEQLLWGTVLVIVCDQSEEGKLCYLPMYRPLEGSSSWLRSDDTKGKVSEVRRLSDHRTVRSCTLFAASINFCNFLKTICLANFTQRLSRRAGIGFDCVKHTKHIELLRRDQGWSVVQPPGGGSDNRLLPCLRVRLLYTYKHSLRTWLDDTLQELVSL